ncbi:hypothetical protein [Proteiniphilum sp. UBA5384]|nr:hypothetical protein [Proteiniphilum sp. UBA5384]
MALVKYLQARVVAIDRVPAMEVIDETILLTEADYLIDHFTIY